MRSSRSGAIVKSTIAPTSAPAAFCIFLFTSTKCPPLLRIRQTATSERPLPRPLPSPAASPSSSTSSSTSNGSRATTQPKPAAQRFQHRPKSFCRTFLPCNRLQKNLHWFYRHTTQSAHLPLRRRSLRRPLRRAAHRRTPQPPTRTPPSSASAARRWKPPASTASSAPKTSPTWASPRSSATCPRIYRSYRRLVASISSDRPDVAILIDFPDVNFRLARELQKARRPGHLVRLPAALGLEAPPPPLGAAARLPHAGHLPLRRDASTAPAASTPSSSATRSPSCPAHRLPRRVRRRARPRPRQDRGSPCSPAAAGRRSRANLPTS